MKSNNRTVSVWYALLQLTYWTECAIASRYAAVYLQYRGMTNTELGIVMALCSLLSLMVSGVLANLIDKSERLTVFRGIFILLVLQLITSQLLPVIHSMVLFPVVYCLFASCYFAENSLVNQTCTVFSMSGCSIPFGICRGMGSLGYAPFSIVLGILIARHNAGIMPGLSLILLSLNLVCTIVLAHMWRDRGSAVMLSVRTEKSDSGVLKFISENRQYAVMIAGLSLLYAANTLVNHFSINIIRHVGGDEASLGYYSALTSIVELPVMFTFDRVMRRVRCDTLIRIAAVGFIIRVLSMALAGNMAQFRLTAFTEMFSYSLMIPAMVRYAMLVIPQKDSAKGQAFATSCYYAGQIIGDYFGGIMFDSLPVRMTILIGAAACAVGCVIIFSTVCKTELIKN